MNNYDKDYHERTTLHGFVGKISKCKQKSGKCNAGKQH